MGRLVDEDDVIDIVNFECGKWTGLSKTIEKGIKALPSAQPTPHWIPCNERLPDIGDIYIVLVDEKQLRPNESRVACAYWLDDKWQYGVLESYEHKMPKLVIGPLEELTVVKWMSLPEPYEGDDHAD